jgi:hypothetical protein
MSVSTRIVRPQTKVGNTALRLRGGADDDDSAKKQKGNALVRAINGVTPMTRLYLLGCLVMAVLTLVGVPEVR